MAHLDIDSISSSAGPLCFALNFVMSKKAQQDYVMSQ